MYNFPKPMQKLVGELCRLPSIGEKSAIRLAYHLVCNDKNLAGSLSESLTEACQKIRLCKSCFFMTEEELCSICSNPGRDKSLLCVVEKPMDLISIERVGEYRGYYHVLHGLWAPLRGQGPEDMKLKELVERLKDGEVREVIIATASTVEGDATALYLSRIIEELQINVTRLAQGMPKGGELEYMDDVTLSRALSGRRGLSES